MPTKEPALVCLGIGVPEAARLLGVHPMTLRRAIYRGQLPAIRLGRKIVIPRVAFDRLAAGTTLAPPEGKR